TRQRVSRRSDPPLDEEVTDEHRGAEGPRPHDGLRSGEEPCLLREVLRRGAGEGQARLREVPAAVRPAEPRALRGRARGKPRSRGPHGHPGRVRGDRDARARPREGGGIAGASCAQMLGDLGADVIKVERPGVGDETRTWGPPFLRDARGAETAESGYYLSTNRNKRSITINFAKPEGAALVRRLLTRADVLIENFKVGGLAEYGLAYDQLRAEYPRLVYCSITGYGQDGPYAARPGYDLMAQGAGGIMSVTGEADGPPVKVGVDVNGEICGHYARGGNIGALRHRDTSGRGQH